MRFRLLLFADSRSAAGVVLLRAVVRAARERADVEVVAVADTASAPPPALRLPRALAGEAARRILGSSEPV